MDLEGENNGKRTLPDFGHDFFEWVTEKMFGETQYMDWFWLPDWFIGNVGITMVLFSLLHPKVKLYSEMKSDCPDRVELSLTPDLSLEFLAILTEIVDYSARDCDLRICKSSPSDDRRHDLVARRLSALLYAVWRSRSRSVQVKADVSSVRRRVICFSCLHRFALSDSRFLSALSIER